MPTEVVTAATVEPLTSEQVKEHLKVENDEENLLIEQYIKGARDATEYVYQYQLCEATLRDWFDSFPCDTKPIVLNRWPVQSVASIKYYDDSDTLQTWAAANYIVDLVSRPARIMVHPDAIYPVPQARINAVQVNYVAGYATPGEIPSGITDNMLFLVGWMFRHRDEANDHEKVRQAFRRMASPYRVRVA